MSIDEDAPSRSVPKLSAERTFGRRSDARASGTVERAGASEGI
jgi:hypothetical protein